ncbi:hypothetical protein LshimejAT787_0209490 [Lyophyllum shimeji]|uniref:Uncharacterized protein n=1 Tax=Lyophyllum shimeji TaxID=47721 RepID=A0A9P3PH68_LYOSH|nr:hypothetical protein LshimejAT787_0209490 [Lyophyllum shimeji]
MATKAHQTAIIVPNQARSIKQWRSSETGSIKKCSNCQQRASSQAPLPDVPVNETCAATKQPRRERWWQIIEMQLWILVLNGLHQRIELETVIQEPAQRLFVLARGFPQDCPNVSKSHLLLLSHLPNTLGVFLRRLKVAIQRFGRIPGLEIFSSLIALHPWLPSPLRDRVSETHNNVLDVRRHPLPPLKLSEFKNPHLIYRCIDKYQSPRGQQSEPFHSLRKPTYDTSD